jgi:protein-L-isoaspartate(D-aspartate) O-methyltransferase
MWFSKLFKKAQVMEHESANDAFAVERKRMLQEQLAGFPPDILAAMAKVPRHEFLPEERQSFSYADGAVPIGFGQTISQPYIVATMTTQLLPRASDRMLEIGTGSGYQAAVLAQLVAEVYTIEIIEPLARCAAATLHRLGYHNIHWRVGDGYHGWPEAAPFDGVIIACAPEFVPGPLIAQLKEDRRMVIPVGPPGAQDLFVFQKHGGKLLEQARLPVRFVPMTGKAESIS